MKSILTKGRLHRENFKKFETKYLALKFIKENQNLALNLRWEASLLLSKIAKKYSKTLIRNHCFLTGRARGFIRFFRLSRVQFRLLARKNQLLTVTKFSW